MSTTGWTRAGSWAGASESSRADPSPHASFRGIDFLLFAAFAMAGVDVQGLPLSELVAGVAVALAVLRRATVGPPIGAVALLLMALLALMVYSAAENDLAPYRRLAHLTLYVALAVLASQGRFHTRAMAQGLATGLIVAAAAFYFGFGSTYEGRLTGLLADPNGAGYLLSTLGCLALGGMTSSRWRWPVGLLIGAAIVLTFSRTSLLATALVLVWMVVGRKLAALFGSMLLALMIYVVTNIPSSLQQVGPFADRSGSDLLRGRIVAAEQVLIGDSPWYGNGPGTSHVQVLGDTFFFHNSYFALENEGGRLAVVLLVMGGVVAFAGLMRLPMSRRNFWYEGSLIALAVCAVNLGEVLLELPTALALGMAVWHVREARRSGPAVAAPDPFESIRLS